MKQFEIGHTYYDTWACDSDSISAIKIISRSEKMVTFERAGKTRRAKIYTDSHGEYIMPDHYSMACVYRADRELIPEEPKTSENPAPVNRRYTVAADLLAFHFIASIAGQINVKQSDFLTAVITASQGVADC